MMVTVLLDGDLQLDSAVLASVARVDRHGLSPIPPHTPPPSPPPPPSTCYIAAEKPRTGGGRGWIRTSGGGKAGRRFT